MYKQIMTKITTGQKLTEEEIFSLIAAINRSQISDVQIAGFQVGLLMKGTSLDELSAFAKAMRANCVLLRPHVTAELMDTCGTGGGLSTFNISTATALVAAAAGIPVAKHGSRSISSLSGSADVLEALGVNINLTPQQAERLIEDIGIAFIYAPSSTQSCARCCPRRRSWGSRPSSTPSLGRSSTGLRPRHLLGVYKPELLDTVTYVARELGYTNAMFVHGLDGLDEISLLGKTRINYLKNGTVRTFEITPEEFGMKSCSLEDIKTGTPTENADTIRGVFSGAVTGPRKDAVVLNAAGALVVGGKAEGFRMASRLAGKSSRAAGQSKSWRSWWPAPTPSQR